MFSGSVSREEDCFKEVALGLELTYSLRDCMGSSGSSDFDLHPKDKLAGNWPL